MKKRLWHSYPYVLGQELNFVYVKLSEAPGSTSGIRLTQEQNILRRQILNDFLHNETGV